MTLAQGSRYRSIFAQSKSFLARCSLSSLKFHRNFTSTCFAPSERLQRSYICNRPGTPFLRFHNLSLSLKGRRLRKRQRPVTRTGHVSAAYAEGAIRCLDLVGPFALRARSKSEGAACRFDSNAANRFIWVIDELIEPGCSILDLR